MQEISRRAYVPYSNRPDAALIVLSDGSWIPGVRVESASFSLTIPALLNAVTTALCGGRSDIAAVFLSRPVVPVERAAMQSAPLEQLAEVEPDFFSHSSEAILSPLREWNPRLHAAFPNSPEDGIRMARLVAEKAFVPESNFPVGCVVETVDGMLIPGVNVEHSDWSRVLCAERNALGTVVSYGYGAPKSIYLSCLRDVKGTPCGACRQLMSELAPQSTLWMDRGDQSPESSDPLTLLPGSFTGTSIPKKS